MPPSTTLVLATKETSAPMMESAMMSVEEATKVALRYHQTINHIPRPNPNQTGMSLILSLEVPPTMPTAVYLLILTLTRQSAKYST